MIYPVVRELAVDPGHRIPVAVTCRVLRLAPSGYATLQTELLDRHAWDTRADLANAIFEYRRVLLQPAPAGSRPADR